MIEQALSVTSGPLTLAATLTLPDGTGPFPAMLLLQGSGPTDRNGNQPPTLMTDLLKQIAHALADRGNASLRFDKRGMHANAAQLPNAAGALSHFFSVEGQLADTEAAWRALAGAGPVDKRRLGILGHSEGGIYALLASAQGTIAGDIRSLVLAATPGRSLAELLREQIAALARRQGARPEQITQFIAAHDRIVAEIVAHGRLPGDIPPGLRPLYPAYLLTYLRKLLPLDPAGLAAQTTAPTLVVQGADDLQVSADTDAWRLLTALRQQPGVPSQLVLLEQTSHNLKRTASRDDHAFGGPVVPPALDAIGDWLARTL